MLQKLREILLKDFTSSPEWNEVEKRFDLLVTRDEIIGPDEPVDGMGGKAIKQRARNELRAKQRKRANAEFEKWLEGLETLDKEDTKEVVEKVKKEVENV